MKPQRARLEAARGFDPRPQSAHRAHLREPAIDVGIDRQEDGDLPPRLVERQAGVFQRAEIGDAGRQHGGDLQRLAGPGLVVEPSVGEQRPAGETGLSSDVEEVGQGGEVRLARPHGRERDRIEAEVDVERGTRQGAPLDEGAEGAGHPRGLRAGVDAHRDEVEFDAVEESVERGIRRQSKATRERAARDDERQRIGAALEVGQRKRVGLLCVGMVEALRHRPGGALSPRAWCRLATGRIERPDGDAIERAGHERLIAGADRLFDPRPPDALVRLAHGRRQTNWPRPGTAAATLLTRSSPAFSRA